MNIIAKIMLIVIVGGVGFGCLFVGLRKFTVSKKMAFWEKIKKSITLGLLFSVSVLSFFCLIPITWWKGRLPDFDINFILTALICMFVPGFITITVGMFIQLSYLEFLISKGKKK